MITIDAKRCPQNHKCPAIKVCKFGAISQQGNGLPVIDQAKCTQCKACVKFCPMGAIKEEAY
jgi:ferredoxin